MNASRAGSEPAVVCRGVSYRYDERFVLRDVNLEIPRGGFTAVLGPNGGGKTTLVKLVTGLLEPTEGQVWVLGTTPRQARERMGYVPQGMTVNLDFPASVMEVVLTGRLGRSSLLGLYSREDKERARAALEAVDMLHRARSSFSALSGGQRQRVLIARALVSDPELLLLDEPTTYLDRENEERFFQLLQELRENMTIVLVTHELSLVARMVETVVCVRGQVRSHPTSELTGETLQEIYARGMLLVHHGHELAPGEEE